MSIQPPVAVTFTTEGIGGGVITLQIGEGRAVLSPVCWSTHPLGDLVRAVLAMAVGNKTASCVFDREPDLFRLEIERLLDEPEQCLVTVWDVDDPTWEERGPDQKLFSAICSIDALARAVESAATVQLEARKPWGYREDWSRRFPLRALAALRAALDAGGPTSDHHAPPIELPPWA